jgi:mono/diheme cytochrome c family protein
VNAFSARPVLAAVAAAIALFLIARAAQSGPALPSAATLARGRALVVFGTCNDCHTPGWREADGKVAVGRWMTGSSIGFRSASGTSYPTNVRLEFQSLAESRWLQAVHTRGGHPPMVWEDLRALPDADLRAIYAFIKSLGPAGVLAPVAIPPWREPATPFIDMRVQPRPAANVTVHPTLR